MQFTSSLKTLEPAAALRLPLIHQHIHAGGAFEVRARKGAVGGGELPPLDRIVLRMARLLLKGHCVISPFMPQLGLTLDGPDSPTVRAVLSSEPHAMQARSEEFAITVAGRHLDLGPALCFHPRATAPAQQTQRALAAVKTGRGDREKSTMRPKGRERLRLLLQHALTAHAPTPAPMPLGLRGFPEPR
ncbi:hypothetical protein SSOG_09086 [Streptomyces himastatinicus ATCC 53653]|uniref:Uncharacterized protein n=1 Tax=Streptomyces himastatinicus ATCC 53653 TaxID=457427 RepID=D9WL97_9ACTN|nr:hypothetical protein SSOG_09086 [Streptomyces himastatinicus ATCC 53653]